VDSENVIVFLSFIASPRHKFEVFQGLTPIGELKFISTLAIKLLIKNSPLQNITEYVYKKPYDKEYEMLFGRSAKY
jgi:hypothetical protein